MELQSNCTRRLLALWPIIKVCVFLVRLLYLYMLHYKQPTLILGMTAVRLPPISQAWSQNFQWSMGVIRLDIFERFATWFLRSTGGNPASILTSVATTSVRIQKRTNSETYNTLNAASVKLSGIRRVSYL